MRALRHIREIPARVDGSLESLLTQFSATTLELNPSLGLAEFSKRLTRRAAEMMLAPAAALALSRGGEGEWELASHVGISRDWEHADQQQLAAILGKQAGSGGALRTGLAAKLLGKDLAETLGWHEVALLRLVGGEGEPLGILCLADAEREISETERRLLEALAGHASVALENVRLFSRIERSRKHWVEDIDAISDFIVVHDKSGRVLRLNRVLADVLGTHPAESVGKDVGQLGLLDSPIQPGRCPFCRRHEAVREEFVHTAGDRTYLISASRIHGGEGDDARTIHVLKDITDRREAERRYRRERDFNRNILNNTQSMILVLDTAKLVSYANRRCFEAGYRQQDLLGHSLVEMVSPSRRPILEEALERTLQGSSVENLEIPAFRGNGATGKFSISLSPMRDEKGDINSIVVVMTDVTDAADLQAKLMHTEKMAALGQLVSGVAHEVNNPLAAIVGFTDLLLENTGIPEDAKGELKVILQEAQRTRTIVRNLLSFARQMPEQREPLQVNSVVQQALKLRSYDLSNRGVETAERYQDDLPLTVGDPNQLQQVFLNIVNNAYDALQEVDRPGKIEISTWHGKGQIEIAFRDNGPGISHPDRIFDPFFTTKEVGKGTGLGLSICYGIVRAHRGEIIARNNPDGMGCTFLVRLPVSAHVTQELAV
ncbi:MAG TPA: PAS domain-containing protein [Candidatus Acidoferrales bacterium]|jgi:two-component system NtrC family sensor kinase|nr:PAS domain-containing protein [Candidatus Acidoferrales bacterium]